jgi:hypothetical protein
MEVLFERVCGLDVHKESVVACLLRGKVDERRAKKEVRTMPIRMMNNAGVVWGCGPLSDRMLPRSLVEPGIGRCF